VRGNGRWSGLASHILDTKAGHFDPGRFKDAFELALRKLVKRKAAGKTIEAPEEKEDHSNVIDLMEALRQSVKGKGAKAAALRTATSSRKTAKPKPRAKRRRRKAA
jgi:DNA end-binding protein Ku